MKRKLTAILLILALLIPLIPASAFAVETVAKAEKVFPYIYRWASKQTEEIEMSGVNYADAVLFSLGYGFNTGYDGEVAYNLKGRYKTMSFKVGFASGSERDGAMTIIADGVTLYDSVTLGCKASPKSYTLNVSGVKHLVVKIYSDGYDRSNYALVNVSAVPNGTYEDKVLVSDEFYDIVRNASGCQYMDMMDEYSMGGNDYKGGYLMTMGYGYSSGYTSKLSFDFNNTYKKMTFDIGRYESGAHINYNRAAYLTIEADGAVVSGYDKKEMTWDALALPVELDLNGVNNITISLNSDGYDKVRWAVGNIQLVSDGHAHGVLVKAPDGSYVKETSITLTSAAPDYDLDPRIYPSDVTAANDGFTTKSHYSIIAVVDDEGYVIGRNGGSGVITITTKDGGHEALVSVVSKLPAAKFVPSIDGWGFGNQYINTKQELYDDVFERISGEAASYAALDSTWLSGINKVINAPQFIYYSCFRSEKFALCNGMSLAAAITYTKDIPFSTWKWNDSTWETPFDVKTLSESDGYSSSLDLNLAQLLFACHLSQCTIPFMLQTLSHNKYDDLFEAVENFDKTGKDPVLLILYQYGVTHTILPYEIVRDGNQILMFAYDPNTASDSERDPDMIFIEFNVDDDGKVMNWSYKLGETYTNADTDIEIISSLSTYSNRIMQKQYFDLAENMAFATSDKLSVSSGGKNLLSVSGNSFSSNGSQELAIPFAPEGSENIGGTMLALASGKDFSIKLNDSARATTGYFLEDSAFIAESCGTAQISKPADGKSLTVDSVKNDQVSIRYNKDNTSVIVKGTVPEAASLFVDDNGDVSFTGYSVAQVTTIVDGKETVGSTQVLSPDETYGTGDDGDIIINTELTYVREYAFRDCSYLTGYQLPKSINAIAAYAFQNCTGLKKLNIPDRVIFIDEKAFDGCGNLTLVVSENSYAHQYCVVNGIPFVFAGSKAAEEPAA